MKRAYRIETVQGILHLQKKLHLYSQALKKKKIQNRINWVLVKAPLFLFKELPHPCNLPISNIVSALFWGGRRRKAVLRALPWITGTIPAGHLQQTGISSHRESRALPFQLHESIRISDERVSNEYPASLFPAKQKGITHSTLFPMTFGWRGGKKE